MKPIAVLDACVLYPFLLRDFFLLLFTKGELYLPRWSDEIQEEWKRNLLANRPDLSCHALERTVALMNSLPFTLVARKKCDVFFPKLRQEALPDPHDAHVIAAALACKANYIVTFNLKDFPSTVLVKYHLTAIHPDTFVDILVRAAKDRVLATLEQQQKVLKRPPMLLRELVTNLQSLGLPSSLELILS